MKNQIQNIDHHLQLLYSHAKGNIGVDAEEIALFDCEGTPFGNAAGRIESNDDKNVLLRLTAADFSGMDLAKRSTKGRMLAYTPLSQKLVAKGKISKGFTFESSDLDIAGMSLMGTVDHRFSPRFLRFISPNESKKYSRTILCSFDKHFLPNDEEMRYREIEDERIIVPFHYGTIEIDDMKFEIRSHEKSNFIRTICSHDNVQAFDKALLLAMSFVAGTKIWQLGVTEHSEISQTSLFRARRSSGSTIFSPVQWFFNNRAGYSMVTQLTKFLYRPDTKVITDLLEIFLQPSEYMEPNARTLLVCTLIEGLIDEILKLRSILPPMPQFQEAQSRLKAFMESDSTFQEFDEIIKNRWNGIIGTASPYNLKNKLQVLLKDLKVNLEPAEEIFFKLRPKLSHGAFTNPFNSNVDAAQEELDQLGYVTNLFNKLLLAAADYRGDFVDYSVPGSRISAL